MKTSEITLGVLRRLRFEGSFSTLTKQVRLLKELAQRSPVVKGKLTEEIVQVLEPGTEYIIVERAQMNALLEGMELETCELKNEIFGKKD